MAELLDNFKSTLSTFLDDTRENIGNALGYGDAMKKAEDISTDMSIEGQYQGEGDAMRHIMFSALATKAYGSDKVPKVLSWLNENVKGRIEGADFEDRDMDLTNDSIGREIGLKAKDEQEMIKLAKEAIANKKAKVIKQTPNEGETSQEMEARIKFEKDKSDLDNM